MLKRPSLQRRSNLKGELELPLVPILDTFVTLIAFLLMATSLLSVTLIDTPVPLVSTALPPPTKPLALTLSIREDRLEISSGFGRVEKQSIPRTDVDYDWQGLHDALLAIKNKFPLEKQLIINPDDLVKYDDIVKAMDTARKISEGDPPLYVKSEEGDDVVVEDLFPDIVFGNVLGG